MSCRRCCSLSCLLEQLERFSTHQGHTAVISQCPEVSTTPLLQALLEAFPSLFDTAAAGCFVAPVISAFLEQNPDVARLKAAMGPGIWASDPAKAVTPAGVLHWGVGLAGGPNEVGLQMLLVNLFCQHYTEQVRPWSGGDAGVLQGVGLAGGSNEAGPLNPKP